MTRIVECLLCNLNTADQHEWNCPNNPANQKPSAPALQGWQCPVCGRVMSPFVFECPTPHIRIVAADTSIMWTTLTAIGQEEQGE